MTLVLRSGATLADSASELQLVDRVGVVGPFDRGLERVHHFPGEFIRAHVLAHLLDLLRGERIRAGVGDLDVEDVPVGIVLGAQVELVEVIVARAGAGDDGEAAIVGETRADHRGERLRGEQADIRRAPRRRGRCRASARRPARRRTAGWSRRRGRRSGVRLRGPGRRGCWRYRSSDIARRDLWSGQKTGRHRHNAEEAWFGCC